MDAMGVTFIEKVELPTYQLRDVAQVWYTKWKDNRAIRVGTISLKVLKRSFYDQLFSCEKRDTKVEEFINLHLIGTP